MIRSALQLNAEGLLLLGTEKYPEATNVFKEAIALDSKFWQAHYNLGLCLLKMQKYDQAIDSFQNSLRLNHKHAESHLNLGLSLLDGNVSKATEAYESAIQELRM